MQNLIDVHTLPDATTFLNYPGLGPDIGSYLGPNDLGEYLTVVDNYVASDGARVGLAFGVYTVNGEPVGTTPIPPEVLLASWTMAERVELAAWQPAKMTPLRGVNRLVMPTHEIHDSRLVVKGID